jgi:hypothetical protein
MRWLWKLALCGLMVSSSFAQHRGGMGGGFARGGGHAGFGGARIGGVGHGFYAHRGFGYGRGVYRRGFYGRGFYRGYWGWPGWYGATYWPWWWDSGFWDWSDDHSYSNPYVGEYPYAGYSSGPNVTVVYPAAAQPAYPVVINVPAQPVVHEYRRPEDYGLPKEHANREVLYLIAFKDHVIRAALAYWVEGDTLHYLDMDHKEMHAPLGTVDRDFSAELNRERHVPFNLP